LIVYGENILKDEPLRESGLLVRLDALFYVLNRAFTISFIEYLL